MAKIGFRARRAQATRLRIMRVAGRLFGTNGFRDTGLREIAKRAGVSLQMANHHFGTKERLFAACVYHMLHDCLAFPILFADTPVFTGKREAAERMATKIRACFHAYYPPSGKRTWCGLILVRAMIDTPRGVLKAFKAGMQPVHNWFFGAIKYIRPEWTPSEVLLWYITLWAQITFYTTARISILKRAGKRRYDAAFLNAAADHLVRVMIAQLEDEGSRHETSQT